MVLDFDHAVVYFQTIFIVSEFLKDHKLEIQVLIERET